MFRCFSSENKQSRGRFLQDTGAVKIRAGPLLDLSPRSDSSGGFVVGLLPARGWFERELLFSVEMHLGHQLRLWRSREGLRGR